MKGKKFWLLVFLLLISVNVKASEIDFKKLGKVEITLKEKVENKLIDGAELTIYKVADAKEDNHNLVFEYVEELKSCEVSLKNLKEENLSEEINKCVSDKVVGKSKVTENGKVTFDNLELGLYLVRQTNKVDGYSKISPYLVMVPVSNDSKWNYEVVSNPKTDIIRVMDLSVKKVWATSVSNVNLSNIPDYVEIALLNNGEVIDTIKLNEDNNWEYTWTDIEKSDAYTVKEINVPKGYTVTYQREDNTFIVTNTTTLVQTGNMPWLVGVFGGLGLILVLTSIVYTRVKNEQD